MFKKFLASVGIGSAKVETRLFGDMVLPGGPLSGEVIMHGGDVGQDIEALYLYLVTRYTQEYDDSTVTHDCKIARFPLSQRFQLQPRMQHKIPFNVTIPIFTPPTVGLQPVFIRTDLEIESAFDASDVDYLNVPLHPVHQAVIAAMQSIGFHLHKVDNEYNPRWGGPFPFVQEFEFTPSNYYGAIKEVEIVFNFTDHGVELYLEIDKRAQGFAALFNLDVNERYTILRLSYAEIQQPDLGQRLNTAIQNRMNSRY